MKISINNRKSSYYTISGAMSQDGYVDMSAIEFNSADDIAAYMSDNGLSAIAGMASIKHSATGMTSSYELDDSAYQDVVDFILSKGGKNIDPKTIAEALGENKPKTTKRRKLDDVKYGLLGDICANLVSVSKRNTIQINGKGLDGSGWKALADLGLYDKANKVQQAEKDSQLQRDALADLVLAAQAINIDFKNDVIIENPAE